LLTPLHFFLLTFSRLLGSNRISVIGRNDFANLLKLLYLRLDYNVLTSISIGAFDPLGTIETL
jgi:Leucine-rich repeat (LRR) protein